MNFFVVLTTICYIIMYTIVNNSDVELGDNEDIIEPNDSSNDNKISCYKKYMSIFVGCILIFIAILIIIQLGKNQKEVGKLKNNYTCKYVNETKAIAFCETGNGKLCTRYDECLKDKSAMNFHTLSIYVIYKMIFGVYIVSYILRYMIFGSHYMYNIYGKYINNNNVSNIILKNYKNEVLNDAWICIIIDMGILLMTITFKVVFLFINDSINSTTKDGLIIVDILNADVLLRNFITIYPIINSVIYITMHQFLNILNK